MKKIILFFCLCVFSVAAHCGDSVLSENAPKDKPVYSTGEEKLEKFHKAIEPYVKQAKETYPQAKRRFLAGLPSGEHFFLTTRLHDSENREEQVFILVNKIENGNVFGIIYSNIEHVHGYKYGQKFKFPESELLDWLISKPDGSEEGNIVGKFMDTYEP